jgi:hypothetical protein
MESATFFYCGCDATFSIRAATSFGVDMWTVWLGHETSTLWLLVRVAYRAVVRTLEEILKHLTVMDAS